MLTKTCIKCNCEKSVTQYNKNPAAKDGLRGYCKVCQKLYLEERKAKRAKEFTVAITEQQCSNCGKVKPTAEFQSDNNAASGFVRECRECKRKKWQEYNKSKPNWNVERKKAYRANGGKEKDIEYYNNNRDKLLARTKQWYLENREKRLLQLKLWRAANPHILYKNRNKRRKALIQADYSFWNQILFDSVMTKLIKQRLELELITGQKYHIDHIIPLQGKLVSGLHVWNNLQVIPAFDNTSKGNKFCIE